MADFVTMPKLGFDMAEGRLVRWMKAEGEEVQKGEVLAEIETDKATVEVEAGTTGLVRKHLVAEGTMVPVGTPIAVIGGADEPIDLAPLAAAPGEVLADAKTAAAPTPPPAQARPEDGDGRLPGGQRASPVARRLAAERGLDLTAIQGTGPGGRVVKRDIEAFLQGGPPVAPSPVATERAAIGRLRQLIGRRMTHSKQQVPHFYVTAEIDAAPVMALREELNALLTEEAKVSVNDFIVKAAALALRQHPNLNASLEDGQIVRHAQVNVGVAVALDEGLLTVVTRDSDRKPLRLLSSELRETIARARQGKVRPEDIEGSTFSLSNMGMLDVDHFIAIINPPEAAILAVGSVREVPVVRDGRLAIGQRMKVTLSADHRVTDGAEAARWLQTLRSMLEHPLRLVL